MQTSLRFHVVDYVVFALTLLISVGIGVYHAVVNKQSTTQEYLLASHKMLSLPVALSLLASFMSGVTILGVPAEIYTQGMQYGLAVLSEFITFPTVALIFVPTIYGLGLTSSYEYLERRFSFGVRIIGTTTFIFYTFFYMAIVTYGPSLALQSVTGLPIWVSIVSIGIVCTFYTTIGGIRAVIWNDVFQCLIMIGGLVTIVIVGTVKVGGPSQVVTILRESNRTSVSFSFDPRERTTLWALFFGGSFALIPLWSVNQTAFQRYMSAKSLKDAQKSVWMAWPINLFAVSLCTLCGAVIFAYYAGCDPKSHNVISSDDQILPYFALDVIGHLYGLPGIFLACLFSGTLSTLSSGVNSLAAIFVEDFVKPAAKSWNYTVTDSKLTMLSKILAAVFGMISIGLSFSAGSLGTIVQSFYSISGVTGAPLVAIYAIGMLTKFANKRGAYIGLICGISFGLFVAIGEKIHKPPRTAPPVSIEKCSGFNRTANVTKKTSPDKEYDGLEIYKISPFWYSFFCFLITFFVGLLVSFVWRDNEQEVDENLLFKWKRAFPSKYTCPCDVKDAQDEQTVLHQKKPDEKQVQDFNVEKDKCMDDSLIVINNTPLVEETTRL